MVDKARIRSSLQWVIGLIGIILTVLFGYSALQERKPSLKFEITSEGNVFYLQKSLDDLDIIFQGKNIKETDQNLRIVTLAIRNDGWTTILQNHFDATEPWGFRIKNAELVDVPRVVNSNSDYLRKKLQPEVSNANEVKFEKVIFERGKFISLELLLLHDSKAEPKISPFGKIAGIDQFTVTYRLPGHEVPTFWETIQSSYNRWYIYHFGKYLLIISIIILGILLVVLRLSLAAYSFRQKAKRGRVIGAIEKHFRIFFLKHFTRTDKEFTMGILKATYADFQTLSNVRSVVSSPETLQELSRASSFFKELSAKPVGQMFDVRDFIPLAMFKEKDDGTYIVLPSANLLLSDLLDFMRENPVPEKLKLEIKNVLTPQEPQYHIVHPIERNFLRPDLEMDVGINWRDIDRSTYSLEQMATSD